PQSDIHAAYKGALHRAMAEDAAAWDAEKAIRRGRPLTPEQVEERRRHYLERIPTKLTRMRYASFTRYFRFLIQLGFVERTGETEGSLIGGPVDARPPESTPRGTTLVEVPQPRVYYRLTDMGRQATIMDLSDPLQTIYNYTREQRSPRRNNYYQPPSRSASGGRPGPGRHGGAGGHRGSRPGGSTT
ncbi:MAG: hypothetical protein ACE5JL_16495, partial [Dehalococcoidia bacterium]